MSQFLMGQIEPSATHNEAKNLIRDLKLWLEAMDLESKSGIRESRAIRKRALFHVDSWIDRHDRYSPPSHMPGGEG